MPMTAISNLIKIGSGYSNELFLMYGGEERLLVYYWLSDQLLNASVASEVHVIPQLSNMYFISIRHNLNFGIKYTLNRTYEVYRLLWDKLVIPSSEGIDFFYDDFRVLMGCPFVYTTALVEYEKVNPCKEETKRNLVESVFSVGWHYYQQLGKSFFRFDRDDSQFKYNRHLSDLLNRYFDTKEKVTAYSVQQYPNGSQYEWEVVMYGRQHPLIQFEERYIFALFLFDSNLCVFKVVNIPQDFQSSVTTKSYGGFSVSSYTTRRTISAMGLWRLKNGTSMALLVFNEQSDPTSYPEYQGSIHYNRILAKDLHKVFENEDPSKTLTATDYSGHLFFVGVLGFYNFEPEETLRMVAWHRAEKRLMVYDTYDTNTMMTKINITYFKRVSRFQPIFCRVYESPYVQSLSKSVQQKKSLRKVFAVLIIILAIISIFSAIVLSNSKKGRNGGNVPKNNGKTATLRANPSNNAIVGRQPTAETSVSKKSQKHSKV